VRGWPLHVVFATILVGSLATKERAADVPVDSADFEPAVRRVAHSQGLAFREYVTLNGAGVRAMVFEAPGCSRPVLVVVLSVVLEYEAVLPLPREPEDVLRYVYIDRSWDKPDRLAFYVQRMKYAALKTFRLTRFVSDPRILLVDAPSRCQAANAIDWRNVWNRDYVGAARADTDEATTR
jgi:hypothetical protein